MKLSQATEQDKIKASAELDEPQQHWEIILDPDCVTKVVGWRYPAGRGYIKAKPYLTRYDAIIPLIQKQDHATKIKIKEMVRRIAKSDYGWISGGYFFKSNLLWQGNNIRQAIDQAREKGK